SGFTGQASPSTYISSTVHPNCAPFMYCGIEQEEAVALKPEDLDFVSNFNTFWAVFLGAILATIGGFGATQAEWILDRRRRERNAAIFFGELLTTMNIILTIADETRAVGDPY